MQIRAGLAQGAGVVRDVPFHRGLNIIATAAPDGSGSVMGHSVGKTLLTRLIRYCLGESSFGSPEVTSAVSNAFPEGYVLATVRVAGADWSVARPIGTDRGNRSASKAASTPDLMNLIDRPDEAAAFHLYEEALLRLTPEVELDGKRQPSWPHVLAWLTRDQECRFRTLHGWREPASGSRAAELSVDDAHRVMRVAMDLLGPREQALAAPHRALLARQKAARGDRSAKDAALQYTRHRLGVLLDEEPPTGSLAKAERASSLDRRRSFLEAEIGNAQARLEVAPADAEAEEVLRLRRDDLLRSSGGRTNELSQTEAQRAEVQSALSGTGEASMEARGIVPCAVFRDAREASEAGCPHHPGSGCSDPRVRERMEAQAERLRERALTLRQQLDQDEAQLEQYAVELNSLTEARRTQARPAESEIRRLLQDLTTIATTQDLLEQAAQLAADAEAVEAALENLKNELEASNTARAAARQESGDHLFRLSCNLQRVLSRLLLDDIDAHLEFPGGRLTPVTGNRLRTAGQAMGTATDVLGFDLACLASCIQGDGRLPAFWIHDSPREADMEDTLYHRYFNVLLELEESPGENPPAFQQIVTTTTAPPEHAADRVCVRLAAEPVEELLLRRELT